MKIMKQCLLLTVFTCVSVFGQSEIIETANITTNSESYSLKCCKKDPKFRPEIHKNLTLECTVPCLPFAEYLSSMDASPRILHLLIHPGVKTKNESMDANNFLNLTVDTLVIDFKFENDTGMESLLNISSSLIYLLNGVQILDISGIRFIEDNGTKKVADINIPTKCAVLHTLRISTSNLREVPQHWLEPCGKLRNLLLTKLRQRNATKEVRRKVLGGLRSLEVLEIRQCYIEELNDELADLHSLQKLDASDNQIHYALTDVVLPSLENLNLSHNHLFTSALLASGVETQPRLRILSLDNNRVLDVCDSLEYRQTVQDEPVWHQPMSTRLLSLPTIEQLSLRGTITSTICFGNTRADALYFFDISYSNIKIFLFDDLPKSKQRSLEVRVTGCPISHIPRDTFTEKHYEQLENQELKVTGLNLTLDCDCDDNLWVSRAVRSRRLVLDRAVCRSGLDLANEPVTNFECTRYQCDDCTCRTYWETNMTDMTCVSTLRSMPRMPLLRVLRAPGGQVENITEEDLPDTLIYLDLTNNHIARMSPSVSKHLVSVPARKMRFYGNPIVCDCQNKNFIRDLMDHFLQVEDYANLTCIDGRFISAVNPDELCLVSSRVFWTKLLTYGGMAAGLVGMLVGLYYRHGRAMKVFLYSKGLCLYCIREEEVDSDRPYDAFISFSHKDEEFVTQNILPELETEPNKYNICVHYRDWIAGELIPSEINRSVDQSKRTIIVLSKNFLESVWGLLEFRTAHLSALKEGRSRVIIVILGEVLNEDLDGELKSYLRLNTYVKWGDPWFWDKLRYALPHRRPIDGREGLPLGQVGRGQVNRGMSNAHSGSADSAIGMERGDD